MSLKLHKNNFILGQNLSMRIVFGNILNHLQFRLKAPILVICSQNWVVGFVTIQNAN